MAQKKFAGGSKLTEQSLQFTDLFIATVQFSECIQALYLSNKTCHVAQKEFAGGSKLTEQSLQFTDLFIIRTDEVFKSNVRIQEELRPHFCSLAA